MRADITLIQRRLFRRRLTADTLSAATSMVDIDTSYIGQISGAMCSSTAVTTHVGIRSKTPPCEQLSRDVRDFFDSY